MSDEKERACWSVDRYVGDSFVSFSIRQGCLLLRGLCFRASPPTWFERLFGVTYEDNIRKARAAAERYAARRNVESEETQRAARAADSCLR